MKQISAPRSALYLRKKVAELAQLTTEEMHALLKLPDVTKAPMQARPKLTRTTLSLQKRFCLMLLMQPALASAEDLEWISGQSDEDILLRQTIETCLQHPHSKPAVLLHALENKVDVKVLRSLQRELSLLDETLDLAQELSGTRLQLRDSYSQKQSTILLAKIGERPLSALTEDEKALLKSMGNKPSQNRA